MPNPPDQDPGCDLACQTKIIINSGNLRGIATGNDTVINRLPPEAFAQVGMKLIQILNRMEDDAVEAQKLLAKAAGYTGPTGKMLE